MSSGITTQLSQVTCRVFFFLSVQTEFFSPGVFSQVKQSSRASEEFQLLKTSNEYYSIIDKI